MRKTVPLLSILVLVAGCIWTPPSGDDETDEGSTSSPEVGPTSSFEPEVTTSPMVDVTVSPGDDDVTVGDDDVTTGDDDTGEGDDDSSSAVDADGDHYFPPEDCDDEDGLTYPDAEEVCDGADNDCDLEIDEDFDQDADTFTTCGEDGLDDTGDEDCDDESMGIHPGAIELCNGIDDNCDGVLDPSCWGTAIWGATTW